MLKPCKLGQPGMSRYRLNIVIFLVIALVSDCFQTFLEKNQKSQNATVEM